MNIRQFLTWADILFVIIVIVLTLSLFFEAPRLYAEEQLGDNNITTGLVYLFVVIATTVFAPFAGLPLAPAVSIIIGPFLTAIYSVIGWTIGAIIAFFIARHLARPFLSRFINMKRLELYESYIPKKHIFFWLVFLRVIIPVDVLSYAIGLTRSVRFPMYLITTVIGIIPFSFIWAYGGYALMERDYTMFYAFSGTGLLLFFISIMYYYLRTE
ncbi:TVP38/TMEM64 family protein [candidate division KSB1 bacterium]